MGGRGGEEFTCALSLLPPVPPAQRLGFSGTPNELVPLSLLPVGYEAAEEAHMLRVLTSPAHTTVRVLRNWTVPHLLAWVGAGAGGGGAARCNALIDVGALVTGLSNLEVAAGLLALGLPHCDGCAFVGAGDEKVILLRRSTGLARESSGAPPTSIAALRAWPAFAELVRAPLVVPLEQCGLPLARLFAFYDQVRGSAGSAAGTLAS